jgi:hypothetical protein
MEWRHSPTITANGRMVNQRHHLSIIVQWAFTVHACKAKEEREVGSTRTTFEVRLDFRLDHAVVVGS